MSRRQLSVRPGFDRLSPETGLLDEEVAAAMLAEDPDEAMALLADVGRATDPALRELARRLAGRVMVDVARRGQTRRAGVGTMDLQPYRPDGGDLDVDASIDVLTARRAGAGLDVEGLRLRSWSRPTTALCLLIDNSGSMRGRPLATAAVGAAAVALRAPSAYVVACFATDVVMIKQLAESPSPERVVDDVLGLRGKGTTDVAAALIAARRQLAAASASRRVTVLFSDCRATRPGDPQAAAAALDELVIVAPDGDDGEATALADAVGARSASVRGPSDVPAALAELLT